MPLLHDLAVLYLAMAENVEGDLSYAERESVTDNLARHHEDLDRAEVQNIVLEVLTKYADGEAVRHAARVVVDSLGTHLSAGQKKAVLQDLARIARADGVVLDTERGLLTRVAESWAVPLPHDAVEHGAATNPEENWDLLHHLAFVYLVLAHAPDHDFSGEERQLILRKLHAWQPDLDEQQVHTVLDRALERYAHGANAEMLNESVEAVKHTLTTAQRRHALNDLVQIANADGIFLDSEEDLLNDLMIAWDVDAFADED
jgi:uncharacterized tellurite resistance protein B-like protein